MSLDREGISAALLISFLLFNQHHLKLTVVAGFKLIVHWYSNTGRLVKPAVNWFQDFAALTTNDLAAQLEYHGQGQVCPFPWGNQ